jgi:hypothetical protein
VPKAFEKIWIFDSDRNNFENWRKGEPLERAWFMVGDPIKRERYRDGGMKSPQFSISLAFEMQLELKDRMINGDLIALGIQTQPEIMDEPCIIPKSFLMSNETQINWEASELSSFGKTFKDVRLCTSNGANPSVSNEITVTISKTVKRGGGRASQYPKAREVLDFLYKERAFRDLSAERLLDIFNSEYQKRFAVNGLKIANVSSRSLRDYIGLFRKESAEIGKN